MRVAHVNDIAFVGSAMVRALRDRGVDAHLVDPARPGRRSLYPWKLATRPLRLAGLLAAGIRLRNEDLDLVHVHFARLGFLGPLAGHPYALECHGTDVRGIAPSSAWGREIAPALRGAALVYYATPDLAPWVEAFRPDAAFLPNPIAAPSAAPPAPHRADILVGVRLDAVKGVDEIAATLRAVLALRPATTITIVAEGVGIDRVRAAAGPAGHLVAPMPHAALLDLLPGHRLAIGQMRLGALGNYELEAMAAGLPLVAAPFRYPAAYDEPPPIVAADRPSRLADRIVALLEDDADRTATGLASAAWVRRHHDPDAVATRLIADYRRVLGEV